MFFMLTEQQFGAYKLVFNALFFSGICTFVDIPILGSAVFKVFIVSFEDDSLIFFHVSIVKQNANSGVLPVVYTSFLMFCFFHSDFWRKRNVYALSDFFTQSIFGDRNNSF